MSEPIDSQLLQTYAVERSERAFAALVSRHAGLVYSTALRQLGDRMLAEEVAQNVFIALARKPWAFRHESTVAGWLYKTTLLQSRQCTRTELRRRRREEIAVELGTVAATPGSPWESMAPLLDEAVLSLREQDRLAVVLRFFEGRPLREVGDTLGISEDAAQKRVAKALELLTHFFRRRGFTISAVSLSASLLSDAARGAPAGWVAMVTPAVLRQAAVAAPSGLAVAAAKLMALSKAQTVAVCLLAGAIPLVISWRSLDDARAVQKKANAELLSVRDELNEAESTLADLKARKVSAEQMLALLRQDSANRRSLATGSVQSGPEIYPWSDSSEYVRVPKTVLSNLSVRSVIARGDSLALSDDFITLLRLSPEQAERINAGLRDAQSRYHAVRAQHYQPTDEQVPVMQMRPSQTRTESAEQISFKQVAFLEAGAELRSQLDTLLRSNLDEERYNLVWHHAGSLFNSRFGNFGRDEKLFTLRLRMTAKPSIELSEARDGGGSTSTYDVSQEQYAPEFVKPTLARWRAMIEQARTQNAGGTGP